MLKRLRSYQAVTSEKNLWSFWDSGLDKTPDWCRRNILSWIRINSPSGWTVRVLDTVPDSPNYALNYVSPEMLPQAFVNGTMDGPYVGPHSADFLRGACLYTHGGIFMDVGIVLIREWDRVCWSQLQDPNSPFQVAVPWMHDLFVHVWKGHDNYKGLIDNALFAPLQESLIFDDTRASSFHWQFSVDAKVVMELLDKAHPDPGRSTRELGSWGAEATIGFKDFGQRASDLLALRLDSDPKTPEYAEAHELTWHLLSQCSMQKVTNGKGTTKGLQLGYIWDHNPGMDSEPGTYGELLGYGTEHFEQMRSEIRCVKAPRPAKTFKKGLLEP
ncbi:hypothetical protein LTR78_006768 [Recurvomyces mirabilis]|uniref:Capsule polysaccharide biosynthesis protein n=1 Tax=Recurvomyces mirabilis TaxID=574656 RepID=A0AAE1BZ91_9PEZI|nr:hypothetical protein LTR78_006768 [Recurvomyces mirabilis]KAK5153243.1 hypothetical protein LTS14_007888 [Recurvomyces mirabilis]